MAKMGDVLVDKKLSLFKRVLESGTGFTTPAEGSEVKLVLEGLAFSQKIFIVGEGDDEIDDYLDALVTSMKQGEKCECEIPSSCVRASTEAAVTIRAHLVEFSPCAEPWTLSLDERMQLAAKLKERGGALFKSKRWRLAARRYSRAIKKLIPYARDENISEDRLFALQTLKCTCHLNLAACQLQLRQFELVVSNCTCALEQRSDDVKALYRRGVALTDLNEFERAESDLRRALEHDPGNKAVEAQLYRLRQKLRHQNKLYSVAMKKMFS